MGVLVGHVGDVVLGLGHLGASEGLTRFVFIIVLGGKGCDRSKTVRIGECRRMAMLHACHQITWEMECRCMVMLHTWVTKLLGDGVETHGNAACIGHQITWSADTWRCNMHGSPIYGGGVPIILIFNDATCMGHQITGTFGHPPDFLSYMYVTKSPGHVPIQTERGQGGGGVLLSRSTVTVSTQPPQQGQYKSVDQG